MNYRVQIKVKTKRTRAESFLFCPNLSLTLFQTMNFRPKNKNMNTIFEKTNEV